MKKRLVIIFIFLFLVACDVESRIFYKYKCSEKEMKQVILFRDECGKSKFIESYCFEKAVQMYCTEKEAWNTRK